MGSILQSYTFLSGKIWIYIWRVEAWVVIYTEKGVKIKLDDRKLLRTMPLLMLKQIKGTNVHRASQFTLTVAVVLI